MLNSDQHLAHYKPRQKIIVAADASSHSVGAAVSHIFDDRTEKAIMHAARSLTLAEHSNSQVEKEALVLAFAMRKFH